jgi:hypothetical protein
MNGQSLYDQRGRIVQALGQPHRQVNRIELIARRQEDRHNGHPDYHVYGRQPARRPHLSDTPTATRDQWFWSVNAVTLDMTVGHVIHGYATGLDDAKAKLRAAFERWMTWARSVPMTDLKHSHIAEELKNMGAEETAQC